jgi:hypothetical protein
MMEVYLELIMDVHLELMNKEIMRRETKKPK